MRRHLIPIILLLSSLLFVIPTTFAQNLSDAGLERAIGEANAAIPNLGRPDRWQFELLFATNDSALSCPLVSGIQLPESKIPFIVTLFFGETTYVVHVADDGSRVQTCDPKFPGMGIQPVSGETQTVDACIVTPNGPFANVRSRPDTEAEQLATIESERPALGRNSDWTWYLVQEGWVAGTVVDATGNCLSNDLSIRDDNIAVSLVPTVNEQGTPVAAADFEPTPIPDFTCPATFDGYLPPRIGTGATTAEVEAGGLPNSIRSLPTTNSDRVGQIQPGRRLDFVWTGPRCSDGFVWWEVEIDGVRGWTAESNNSEGEYYLQPVGGAAPAPTVIATIPTLVPTEAPNYLLAELPADSATVMAVSPTANELAYGKGDTITITPFPALNPIALAQLQGAEVTALAYSHDGTQLYVGLNEGTLIIFDVEARAVLATAAAHSAQINAIVSTGNGTFIATGSGTNDSPDSTWSMRLWDTAELLSSSDAETAMARNVRFPYPVVDLMYTTGGLNLVITAALTGEGTDSAAIWVYDNQGQGENIYSTALDYRGAASVTQMPMPLSDDFVYTDGTVVYWYEADSGEARELVRSGAGADSVTYTDMTISHDSGGDLEMLMITSSYSLNGNTGLSMYRYDYQTETMNLVYPLSDMDAMAVSFNHDDTLIVALHLNGTIGIYSLY